MNKSLRDKLEAYFREVIGTSTISGYLPGLLEDKAKIESRNPNKSPTRESFKTYSCHMAACQQWDREMNAVNYLIKIAEPK